MNDHDLDPYLMTRAALEKLVKEQQDAIVQLIDEADDRSKIIERLRIRNADLILQLEEIKSRKKEVRKYAEEKREDCP